MVKAINPISGDEMILSDTVELNELLSDSEGNMFEVISVNADQAELSQVQVEEDWGE